MAAREPLNKERFPRRKDTIMIIDLHTHEYLHSACARMSLEEAVTAARHSGLDGICITNHDSLGIRYAEYLRTADFPVFVGVEFFTNEGDIIAFGLEHLPSQPIGAQKFIDFVAGQGGFCFAAHPFRRYGGGLGKHIYAMKNLSGVEVLNGANLDAANLEAVQACEDMGLIPVGGSDAHFIHEVGLCATWFPERITSEQELLAALKSGNCRPVVKTGDRKWTNY